MADLGTKQVCEECGAKFYDLGRTELNCPKCGWNPKTSVKDEAPESAKAPAKSKRSGS